MVTIRAMTLSGQRDRNIEVPSHSNFSENKKLRFGYGRLKVLLELR